MVEHLSDYAVELHAAGEATAAGRAHLAGCAACAARLAEVEAAGQRVRAMPEFERRFAAATARRRSGRARLALPMAMAMAMAAALLLLLAREPPGERVKGGPLLRLMREDGSDVSPPLRVGDRVALVVRTSRGHHALVMAVNVHRQVSKLWPVEGDLAGPIVPGTALVLAPTLEVTAGSALVVAFFSETPLDPRLVQEALLGAAMGDGGEVHLADLPALQGEVERAQAFYEVSPP